MVFPRLVEFLDANGNPFYINPKKVIAVGGQDGKVWIQTDPRGHIDCKTWAYNETLADVVAQLHGRPA